METEENVIPKCDECRFHNGIEREIKTLKESHSESVKIIGRMIDSLNGRVTMRIFLSFVTVSMLIFVAFFGLLYNSQSKLFEATADIKTSVAVLNQKTTDVGVVLRFFRSSAISAKDRKYKGQGYDFN